MTWFAKLALATKILVVPVVFLIALGFVFGGGLTAIDQQLAAIDQQRAAIDQQRMTVTRQLAAVENLGNVQVDVLTDIAGVSDALTRAQLSLHNLIITAVNEYDSDKISARSRNTSAKLEAIVPTVAALDLSGFGGANFAKLRADAIAGSVEYQAAAFAAADMAPLDVGSAGIILNDATRLYEVLAGDLKKLAREVESQRVDPAVPMKAAEVTFPDKGETLRPFLESVAVVTGAGLILILLICGQVFARIVKMAGSMAALAAENENLEKTVSRQKDELRRITKSPDASRENAAEIRLEPVVAEKKRTGAPSLDGSSELELIRGVEAETGSLVRMQSTLHSVPVSALSLYGGEAADISDDANEETTGSDEAFQGLVDAAVKNHEVIEFISEIAEQANLRALNATLDAARSGDAGTSYAALAAEAKALAEQASDENGENGSQIVAMQSVTGDAVEAARSIRGIIGRIREISEAMTGTSVTGRSIDDVAQAASETGDAAREVLEVAIDLSEHAQTLNDQVENVLDKGQAA